MALWYIPKPTELLLDLDAWNRQSAGTTWGEVYFRRRLRTAMAADRLRVQAVHLARSSHRIGHLHAAVILRERLPLMVRLVWHIHLGSDLYKGRADLMRGALGCRAPSLLIRNEPFPSWDRQPDHVCPCEAKHVTAENPPCPVWRKLRGPTPWEMFGPTVKDAPEERIDLALGEVPLDRIMARRLTQ